MKNRLRSWLPSKQQLASTRSIRWLGHHLKNDNLWHLNRRSVCGGVAVGLFAAFIPLPIETLIAALAAIILRVNLPISCALVWVSNPVTWVPLYAPGYWLGCWILETECIQIRHLLRDIGHIHGSDFAALVLGCMILGAIIALLGYFATLWLWRWKVSRDWQKRREARRLRLRRLSRD
ncbi:DUF2062 domain-containing protein [Gammaproteobacteria bacterium]|nr:DUF2062 domain-containing protein [Gammaproteobacteria bacterium]